MKPRSASTDLELLSGAPRASVLVVDDVPQNLVALEAALADLEAVRVVKAASGDEALRCVLEEDFAVILMDVRMPGMNGLEAAALIHRRRRTRDTPIIFVSALSSDAALIARGYRQGAVDFLVKPFEPEILRSKVAVFVDLYVKGERIKQQEALLRQRERAALERESERRYRGLVDALPLSIWALGPDGAICYENRHWLEFSGGKGAPSARVWEPEALHPEDRATVQAAWEQATRSGRPFEILCRLRRQSDGADRWHVMHAVPERSPGGAITGWVVAALDIDDRRRAAMESLAHEQEARRDAEERVRLKDEFLAIVSHELRTPLSGILGWARVLRTGKRGAVDAARAIEAIERNARAQARVVDDLLDATRLVSGRLHLEVRAVDLRALMETALDAVHPTAEAKGITLDVALEDTEAGAYEGDPVRIQQVCWNLLANSLKFTPPGGRIEVHLRAMEGAAELRVRDTGEGIAPAFLPHVFEAFRQADTSTKRLHGGIGLGLALVHRIVELHGGTVRVESPGEGQGTTFTVTLPKRKAGAAPPVTRSSAAKSATSLAARSLDGVRVLVVDDDDDARALLAVVLQSRGAEVTMAASVPEAAEAFQRARPDVVLCDLAMPREDGFSLIRWIRSLHPEQGGAIPAAAVTAHAEPETAERARSAGFQTHVAKPFDPSRLATTVARLAGGRARPNDVRSSPAGDIESGATAKTTTESD